jgi:hypothetical protein
VKTRAATLGSSAVPSGSVARYAVNPPAGFNSLRARLGFIIFWDKAGRDVYLYRFLRHIGYPDIAVFIGIGMIVILRIVPGYTGKVSGEHISLVW